MNQTNPDIIACPITPIHIAQGQRQKSEACALALAINDHPQFYRAHVGVREILIYIRNSPDRWLTLAMHPMVVRFMIDFDATRPVHPCTLHLDLVQRCAFLIYPAEKPTP